MTTSEDEDRNSRSGQSSYRDYFGQSRQGKERLVAVKGINLDVNKVENYLVLTTE